MKIASIVLAAGKGTRMKSKQPKVLHPICGRPMIHYAVNVAINSGAQSTVVVIGYGADAVKAYLGESVQFALQTEQLGTGHAVLAAQSAIAADVDLVLVTNGDMPLLTDQTLSQLIEIQKENTGPLSLLTMVSDDSFGFGRIVRS